jgi:hypothetical protein
MILHFIADKNVLTRVIRVLLRGTWLGSENGASLSSETPFSHKAKSDYLLFLSVHPIVARLVLTEAWPSRGIDLGRSVPCHGGRATVPPCRPPR